MTSDVPIDIARLSKTFYPLRLRLRSLRPLTREPPVCALRDVSLRIHHGEIVGLLGTNGAGKTTLLKILSTMVLPTAGRVLVHGRDVAHDGDRIKRSIGWVSSDERSFYWRLTGQQNLEFFAAFHGVPVRAARARITDLRDQLGLDALNRRYGLYSSGMKHRLSLARALLHQPDILLLDEPTRSLDPLAAIHLRRLLKGERVNGQERTILIATHNLQEAEELCDRIAVLHQGRLAGCGTLEELRRQSGDHTTTLSDVFERLTMPADQHE